MSLQNRSKIALFKKTFSSLIALILIFSILNVTLISVSSRPYHEDNAYVEENKGFGGEPPDDPPNDPPDDPPDQT